MTEADWRTASDPIPMLDFLGGKASERKFRLFHAACCERVEHLLRYPRSRSALACVRRSADAPVGAEEWQDAGTGARAAMKFSARQAGAARYGAEEFERMEQTPSDNPGLGAEILGFDPATNAAAAVLHAVEPMCLDLRSRPAHSGPGYFAARAVELASGAEAGTLERLVQSQLLRDIVGNPFHPTAVDPGWLTETVVALATGIYAERAFDRMPILADALEDAGCDHADILNHCRGDGPHVRGCWVVDLVPGRS